ncbi:NmrA-domain-containing protein [Microthyrium microscopicum]|uniref:NmrA-domain-containing protein n=1 Tax=Microthyrium microscopicum TaxID=703497 RepID=A0A6A6U5F1_9PEZI|nr:NmrA-domain-containing protein [Microthyrium microscopicum]
MSKLLTVFGATRNQGGSVIRRVLDSPELSNTWKFRGITRDVSKPAAVALREKGVEMVTADMNGKESLTKPVKDSAAVFGVTNFWLSMSADTEIQLQPGKINGPLPSTLMAPITPIH